MMLNCKHEKEYIIFCISLSNLKEESWPLYIFWISKEKEEDDERIEKETKP